MANGTIAVDEPTTVDKLLDAEELTVAAQTVLRERVQVAGATDTALAAVTTATPTTEFGLVVRIPSLPAGTNAIGKLAANSGVDIGDVDVTSLPAITGSVTANAGTNLNTSALALESGGNLATLAGAIRAEDAASADGHTGHPVLAVRKATPANTSGADGDYEFLQMSAGRLWASATIDAALPAGNNNIGDVDIASLPALAAGTNNIGDVDVLTVPADPFGVNADAASATGSISAKLRFIAATGIPITSVVPGTGATNLGKAEDAAHTTGDVGVMALGVRAAAPTERSAGPTDGDYEPFATNEVGAVWVSVTPSANGGATTLNSTSSDGGTALTNSAQAIKASAGTLKGYYIYNPNSSAQFVQFYNTASGSVTVGTTNPLFMLTIPATSAANLWMTDGVAFSTAMSWAATSTAGGNGAPTTALDAVAWYK